MKLFLQIFVVILIASFSAGCRQHDFKEHTIKIPDMSNDACAKLIRDRLTTAYRPPPNETQPDFTPVEVISVDIAGRTVKVRYESLMMAKKNLDFVVADLGFTANDTPGNPEAAAKLGPEYGFKQVLVPMAQPVPVAQPITVPILPPPAAAVTNS